MRHLLLILFLFPAISSAAPIEVRVVQSNGKPVKDAVVYVTASNLPVEETTTNETLVTEVSQNGRAFKPYISVVRVNKPVLFTNKDDISHHIYSITGPLDFSFVIRASEQGVEKSFPSEGVVAMGCNIHDWMSGYIKVVDTPYYTITGKSGVARITLPDGLENVTLTAWHPQMNETLQTEVAGGQEFKLALTKKMSPIPKQKNAQMIDFYGSYK
ncbi:hypothetical protein [Vibrio coralliilyticus]|uniref:hypothetical protein n=1 Tax=Vibrio coralliilyticus TaxID=190893 RepID=UPI00155FD07E|nr:hypothetical protein [Vibrio coralliilyticus]NRF61384.1 hypothetical protein [Vibrio coralliilyticus]